MARYTEAVCRLCRRENTRLYLKGDRCRFGKCAIAKKDNTAPGQHGTKRGKLSEFGLQLREKQKVKRSYGLLEKQFRALFEKAERQTGVTGENLLILLERRLDNIVYRLGFTNSRNHARQLVRHGHILVNGHKVDIPSYLIKNGDVVAVREKSRKNAIIIESLETVASREAASWLDLDKANFSGQVKALPTRSDLPAEISEQLIVELYSK